MKVLTRWGVGAVLVACTGWSTLSVAYASTPTSVASKKEVSDVQALLAQVRQRVQDAPVVRGQFTQRKTVQGFKQPLQSSGDFVVARGKGIAWQVRQPFVSTLIVKPDSLLSRGADGRVAMQMKAQDEPVLRTINAMLFAVMAADLVQLAQYFEVTGSVQGANWSLHLVPRDAMLAQWLQAVDLRGQQFVQEVQLLETRGDRSQIFIENSAAEQSLQAQDALLFE